jgi:hypothetical protein
VVWVGPGSSFLSSSHSLVQSLERVGQCLWGRAFFAVQADAVIPRQRIVSNSATPAGMGRQRLPLKAGGTGTSSPRRATARARTTRRISSLYSIGVWLHTVVGRAFFGTCASVRRNRQTLASVNLRGPWPIYCRSPRTRRERVRKRRQGLGSWKARPSGKSGGQCKRWTSVRGRNEEFQKIVATQVAISYTIF